MDKVLKVITETFHRRTRKRKSCADASQTAGLIADPSIPVPGLGPNGATMEDVNCFNSILAMA